MRKLLYFVSFVFAFQIHAQEIIVNFSGELVENQTTVALDSVNIENLTQEADITIPGNSSFNLSTGVIVGLPLISEKLISKVYPNPFTESTNIDFYLKNTAKVSIMAYNLSGQLVANWQSMLSTGSHSCEFFSENTGIYFLNIQLNETIISSKVISLSSVSAKSEIVYRQQIQTETEINALKSGSSKNFPFNLGDVLQYTGYYEDYMTMMIDTPVVSTSYLFEIGLSSENELLSFNIEKAYNPGYIENFSADITGTDISLELPDVLDLTQVIPSFELSNNASAYFDGELLESGVTAIDVSSPQTITIEAQDGTTSDYNLIVSTYAVLQPNFNINSTTSYQVLLETELWSEHWISAQMAIAYYDFDDDGDDDIIVAHFNQDEDVGIPMQYFENDGAWWEEDNTVFGDNIPETTFGRKICLQDFNADGNMDVLVASHGYDFPPFPGDYPVLLLNQGGTFIQQNLDAEVEFYHSAAAGDIDHDGDIDIMLNGHQNYFFLNDGNANFTLTESLLPDYEDMIASEFYDVNNDGYLDILDGSDDNEIGQNPDDPNYDFKYTHKIYLGNYTGKYFEDLVIEVPVIDDYGNGTDWDMLDINGDGNMEILLSRTGDKDSPQGYAEGHYLQLFSIINNELIDITTSSFDNYTTQDFSDPSDAWYVWLRFVDIDNDGDYDIVSNNRNQFTVYWTNNDGYFTKFVETKQ